MVWCCDVVVGGGFRAVGLGSGFGGLSCACEKLEKSGKK